MAARIALRRKFWQRILTSTGPAMPVVPRLVHAVLATALLCLSAPGTRAQDVTLTSRDGALSLSGTLLAFDGEIYRIDTDLGVLTLDAEGVRCAGPGCPSMTDFVAEIVLSGAPVLAEEVMPALLDAFSAGRGQRLSASPGDAGARIYTMSDATGAPIARFHLRATSSTEAFADIATREADLALSLRLPRPDERAAMAASGLGDLSGPGQRIILGLDGLVFVASPLTGVTHITLDAARAVLAGEIADWSALGGPEAPIALYLPDPSSSLGEELQTLGMLPRPRSTEATDNDDAAGEGVPAEEAPAAEAAARAAIVAPAPRAIGPGEDMAALVARDPFGFGVTTRARAGLAQPLAIDGGCGRLLHADPALLKTEDYPLVARLYLFAPDRRLPRVARDLIAFVTSDTAQAVLARQGFVGQDFTLTRFTDLGDRLAETVLAAGEEITLEDLQNYVATLREAVRLSATFRFETGSTELDARSISNLGLLAERVELGHFDGRTLVFAGFTDADGSAEANRRIALRRAATVRAALRAGADRADLSRLEMESIGFGAVAPIACEDSPEGKRINRRVEVWLR